MHPARTIRTAAALLALGTLPATAQTLDGTLVASGLQNPTWVGSPPGDARVFVTEQYTGAIRIVADGEVVATFLDLGSETVGPGSQNGERGLLGMAFHPDFANNGYVFVHYTASDPLGDSRIERYRVDPEDPDALDPSTAKTILEVVQPHEHHNGGDLNFGPDGFLYIGLGDGGFGDDPFCVAQNPTTLLGKILRIDVDVEGAPYAVPEDNPFVGLPGWRPEIWHLGLRNPWRFRFDRGTGDLYVADVGQSEREEINFQPAGRSGLNFGWKIMEGSSCNSSLGCQLVDDPPSCGSPFLWDPVWDYGHTPSSASAVAKCCVTGGEVYRGDAMPWLRGSYFFSDACSGEVWTLRVDGTAVDAVPFARHEDLWGGPKPLITSFGQDGAGEILLCTLAGEIWRIDPQPPWGCPPGTPLEDCPLLAFPGLSEDLFGGPATPPAGPELSASVPSVSIQNGGVQELWLHPGIEHAGRAWFVAGSFSGTSPGVSWQGATLPLNPDSYFVATASKPNTLPMVDSVGVLDAWGEGVAGFSIPAGLLDTSLVGLTFHHAYIVWSLGPLTVYATSNAVPVSLTP